MKNEKIIMSAGVLSAIASSLCCILPVLALLAGTSSIASVFSWIEPFRPFLIILTILIIGFAWYQRLKTNKQVDCVCGENSNKISFIQSKTFLALVTLLSVIAISFPHYSRYFFPEKEKVKVISYKPAIKSVEFKIKGMTCKSCEEEVKYEVNKLNGILFAEVSYENKNATINFDSLKTNESAIKNAINATGYKVIELK